MFKIVFLFVGIAALGFFALLGYLAFSELNVSPYKSMYTMSEAFIARDVQTFNSYVDQNAIAENLYKAVDNEEMNLTKNGVTRKIWLDPRAKGAVKPLLKRSINKSINECVLEQACLPQINNPNGRNMLTLHPLVLFTAMSVWLQPKGGLFSPDTTKVFEGTANGELYRLIFEKELQGEKRWILTGVMFPEITNQLLNQPRT